MLEKVSLGEVNFALDIKREKDQKSNEKTGKNHHLIRNIGTKSDKYSDKGVEKGRQNTVENPSMLSTQTTSQF